MGSGFRKCQERAACTETKSLGKRSLEIQGQERAQEESCLSCDIGKE